LDDGVTDCLSSCVVADVLWAQQIFTIHNNRMSEEDNNTISTVEDGTDLINLVAPKGRYLNLVESCFQSDDSDGDLTWLDAKESTQI
jgi:hypothetical protein